MKYQNLFFWGGGETIRMKYQNLFSGGWGGGGGGGGEKNISDSFLLKFLASMLTVPASEEHIDVSFLPSSRFLYLEWRLVTGYL